MDYDLDYYLKHNFYRDEYFDEKDSLLEDSNFKMLNKKINRDEFNTKNLYNFNLMNISEKNEKNLDFVPYALSRYLEDIQKMIDFVKKRENLNEEQKNKLESALTGEIDKTKVLYNSLKLKGVVDEDGIIVDKTEKDRMYDITQNALKLLRTELRKFEVMQYIHIPSDIWLENSKYGENFNSTYVLIEKHTKPYYDDEIKSLKQIYTKNNAAYRANISNFNLSPYAASFQSPYSFINKIKDNKKLTEKEKGELYIKLEKIYSNYRNKAKNCYYELREQEGMLDEKGKILDYGKNKEMEGYLNKALEEIKDELYPYNVLPYEYEPRK